METFFIENFGCRATEADAVALRRGLAAQGFMHTSDATKADVIVLNTCTVTAAADSQAREAVRKMHRANPGARIVVTGCYAQRAPEELASLEGVDYVVGNAEQRRIPALVGSRNFVPVDALKLSLRGKHRGQSGAEFETSREGRSAMVLVSDIFDAATVQLAPASLLAGDRTRPILKIQDGCNNRCSYCVIPFVRGRSRSLPPDVVVQEVRELVAAGAKEIVLSGINLGSYGRDFAPRASLSETVGRILQETTLDRLRFSSIEPQDVTEDFVKLVAYSSRLAPHFHVPMQSGSDRVLKAMHRWYRSELYAERIEVIRRLLPDAAIGADVIVGFPGETGEDFQVTLDFIERLPLTYLHVFSFSARPGTEAVRSGGEVPAAVIRERARALRSLSATKNAAFRAGQAGRTMRALTLGRHGDGWTEALTGNFLKVRLAGRHAANEWHELRMPCDGELANPDRDGSALENHLGEGEVAAVGDGEGNFPYSETVGELARHAREM